jgi:ankyrin repeat protein
MKKSPLITIFPFLFLMTPLVQASELLDAVEAGDKVKVEMLLSSGADINERRDTGDTPLTMAVLYDQKEMVNFLVAKGSDVNAKTNCGGTPLDDAAMKGNKEAVALFIAKGANVNAKGCDGRSPLYDAAAFGHKDVADFLIAKGADINAKDKYGRTPLYGAASEGYKDVVEFLVTKGADINARVNQGWSLLHAAKNQEIAEFLIAKGADVNVEDVDVPIADSISLRGGELVVKGEGGDAKLFLNDKKLRDGDGYMLYFENKYAIGNKDIILMMNNSGGTACPVQYFFVTVSTRGSAQLSSEF